MDETETESPTPPEAATPVLRPLAYHVGLVEHLKATEPEVWAWASSMSVLEQHVRDTRSLLLRETYRLTPESHPEVYAIAAKVMARLELDAPVTIYQAGAGGMNAALHYLPGEVHVVLHGPVLERLQDAELTALLGHELAHYRLWSGDGGDFHVAERILGHTLADPAASNSHHETARLYGLHTEFYADRGAALAAGAPEPAIATLVKVETGLGSVDPAAYLQQAGELEAGGDGISQGLSHPETYLRAQALDKWWRDDPEFAAWLRRRVHGPLCMDRLDLADQIALKALTRRFISLFLQPEALRSERTVTQAQAYFPDWAPGEPIAGRDELGPAQVAASVREFLNFVMLDLALADPDVRDAGLQAALALARDLGSVDALVAALKRDVGLGRREVDKLLRALPKEAKA